MRTTQSRGVQEHYQFRAPWLTRDTMRMHHSLTSSRDQVLTGASHKHGSPPQTWRLRDDANLDACGASNKLTALSLYHAGAGRLSLCQWSPGLLQLQAPDIPQIVLQLRTFGGTSELRAQGVNSRPLLSLNDVAEHRKNGAIQTHYYNI